MMLTAACSPSPELASSPNSVSAQGAPTEAEEDEPTVTPDEVSTQPTATPLPDRAEAPGEWMLHTISDKDGGPDGVKLVDVDGDGWLDITTAYEWSGAIMMFIRPGREKLTEEWPAIQVGKVESGEDALAIDLNGDGNLDVISAHEGDELVLSVHWAPSDPEDYRNPDKWGEDYIRASRDHSWLFLVPMDVNEDGEMDIVAGAKDDRDNGRDAVGELAWLNPPEETSGGWQYHPIGRLNWPMSIIPYDVDQDGDLDLFVSDRRGDDARRGMRWFENPGQNWEEVDGWRDHYVANLRAVDPFFVSLGDLDGDGAPELVVPIENPRMIVMVSLAEPLSDAASGEAIELNYDVDFGEAHFKSVEVGDIDLDGFNEIVVTFVDGNLGIGYFDHPEGAITETWAWVPLLQDLEQPKFDLAQLYDVDGDGDLDIITTEDVNELGVIWLENPNAAK